MKKSQVSLEFIILIGMAFVFFMAFLAIIQNITVQKQRETNYQIFYDLAKSIQEEILTVSEAEPGLIIVFEIPPPELNYTVQKRPYTLSNTNNSLTLAYEDHTIVLPLPYNEGNLRIGQNTLRNVDGVVYIE